MSFCFETEASSPAITDWGLPEPWGWHGANLTNIKKSLLEFGAREQWRPSDELRDALQYIQGARKRLRRERK